MLQEKLDNVVSFHASMFPHIYGKDIVYKDDIDRLAFFSSEEMLEIRKRITHFQNSKANGVSSRKGTTADMAGGSQLLKELEKIEITKRDLNKWLQNIRDILSPREITRTTLVDAKRLANNEAIARTVLLYGTMKEVQLRSFASLLIGEVEQDYTIEELPMVVATKQITGVLLPAQE